MTRLVKQTLMMVQKMQNWVKMKKWHLPESLFKTSCQKIAWLIRCIVGMSEYQWLAIRCPCLSCHRLRCRKNNCYRQMYVERWSTCWWFQRRLRPEKILSLHTSKCSYRSFKVYLSRKQFHSLFSQRLPFIALYILQLRSISRMVHELPVLQRGLKNLHGIFW